jgi:uncharacterized membrane protein
MSAVMSDRVARTFLDRVKLVGVASAAALVSVNIWTGGPLLALWIGSRIPQTGLSFGAVVMVVLSMVVIETILVFLLGALNTSYQRLSGAPPAKRQRASWLRAMSDTEATGEFSEPERPLSTVERVLVVNVVAAAILFEVFFFFFAHISLAGGGSY